MIRLVLLAFVIISTIATPARAEELLLRLEERGFTNEPQPDAVEKTLRVMEVVVHADQEFYSKVIVGKETLTLAGKLVSDPKGNFKLEVRHHRSIDTGETVLISKDRREPVLDEQSFDSTLEMTLNQPVKAGGFQNQSISQAGTSCSKSHYTMTLLKHDSCKE